MSSKNIGFAKSILNRMEEDPSEYDLEAEFDSELTFEENWEEFKEKHGLTPKNEIMEEIKDHPEMSEEKYYQQEKETVASEYNIDPENIEDFRELVNNEDYDALKYWSEKINPKVTDMKRVKKAILLSLASHGDEYGDRGRIHILLSGDPGTAKSEIRMWVSHRLGAETVSQRSTKVGLTGDARGKEITPGALPRADTGVLTIDELDEFKPKDRQGLLEAMSEGVINIEAGGMSAEFKARTRIIGATNATESFSPELLDRFDFHFELEKPEEDDQKEIMDNIVDSWFQQKEGYEGIELKEYLKWVKPYRPEIRPEVREKMKELIQYHIDLEKESTSIRQKESIIRIAYTLAKINRREMKPEDVIRAIELKYKDLNNGHLEALQMKAQNS